MEGSDWVALVAVIVTGISIVVTYLGSGKRLKHEAKMQTERLADEKRREGLPLAAKAYRLASDVRRRYELLLVEKRAGEEDAFRMGSEAKQAVGEAVNALELVTVAGSDIMIQTTANLTLIRIAELDHSSLSMIGAIQRNATHRAPRVSDKYQQTWSELGEALESFGRAIRNSPVTQGE